MKYFLKKKQLMVVALVAAIGMAVVLNVYLTDSPALTAGTEQTEPSPTDPDEEHLGDATFVGTGVTDPEEPEEQAEPVDYFEQARENRATAREEALGIIQDVLDNAQTSAEDKKAASQQASAIAANLLRESNIENLILAKGFEDSVVYLEEDSCRVVVQAEALQQQESLQIMEIVLSQTGISADKVQIMAAKA